MENEIKKYYCRGCENYVKILIWISKYSKYGYLCQNCQKKLHKRLLQIYRGY